MPCYIIASTASCHVVGHDEEMSGQLLCNFSMQKVLAVFSGHSVSRNRGALWSEQCCLSTGVLLPNNPWITGRCLFAWFLLISLQTDMARCSPWLCRESRTVWSFVIFVVIYFVIPFFPLCFNMLTIAVCSCLGMDVNLLFLHHAL